MPYYLSKYEVILAWLSPQVNEKNMGLGIRKTRGSVRKTTKSLSLSSFVIVDMNSS